MELNAYVGLFLYFGLMVAAGLFFVGFSHLCQISVKTDKYDWSRPYECGIRTEGLPMDRYPIHYYLVGIMFVIFDVETVFMVPWAIVGHDFKFTGSHVFWFVEMLVFLVILIIGYIYLLQERVFDWGREERPTD
jgi:NADH-quinone oxidoreductase subunit A